MTIFDTLRYPNSDPPTEEQLRALPIELYEKWIHQSGWTMWKEYRLLANVLVVHAARYEAPYCLSRFAALRQMIKDYDNI